MQFIWYVWVDVAFLYKDVKHPWIKFSLKILHSLLFSSFTCLSITVYILCNTYCTNMRCKGKWVRKPPAFCEPTNSQMAQNFSYSTKAVIKRPVLNLGMFPILGTKFSCYKDTCQFVLVLWNSWHGKLSGIQYEHLSMDIAELFFT
jgi:hypothetical protein